MILILFRHLRMAKLCEALARRKIYSLNAETEKRETYEKGGGRMKRNARVCALLLAMGLVLGARTYFLTVKDGRICYQALPGAALVDTGRSVSMLPRAVDRALLSQGVYFADRAALTRALEDFCS